MDLLRAARLTIRDLLRSPGYTSAAVLTLGLVVGANSAIFSAVHAVLLTPPPIQRPDELVVCWERDLSRNLPVVEVSYRNFQDWVAHSRSFSSAAAMSSSTWPAILDGRGEPTRLSSAGVSASFFETLGVRPIAGRVFGPEEDLPNSTRVAILSHGLWMRRFGGDPGAIGTTIQLSGPHIVIGVMPEGFDFPRGTDIWLPVVPILANAGGGRLQSPLENVGVLFVVGRLREGTTPARAAEELDGLAARLEQQGSAHRFGSAVVVTSFVDYLLGPVRQALWALLAAVGVLLLIGCANVSGLMLTRVSVRRREHAIRVALGATPARIGRKWALEALILSMAGGCLGLLASRWIVQGIVALAPGDVPRVSDIAINLPVAAFTFLAVVLTGLLCGAPPVWHAGSSNPVESLSESARAAPGRRSTRSRGHLLVFQIALTVVLLVAGGLVARSFVNLRRIDLGFTPANVLTMSVAPRAATPSINEWVHELLRHVEAIPDVEAAGGVKLRPLALGPIGAETWVILEGQADTPQSARTNPILSYQVATPRYFTAMRIGLLRGRLFDERDTAASRRVALVSESAARALWPGADPVGRRILMPTHSSEGGASVWRTVVGVVSDVRYRGLDDVRLDVYDAALQSPAAAAHLVIRTSRDPLVVAAAVQAEARRLDPRVVIDQVTTMDAIVTRALAPWRFSLWLFAMFAALAFVLAAVGLFSVVSLDVSHRRHEFAVRLALGAERGDVRQVVLSSAFWRVVPGLAFGIVGAMAGTRAVRHILFGVAPIDPATYVAVALLVCAVVIGAAWLPAHRAAGVDPLALLRRGW